MDAVLVDVLAALGSVLLLLGLAIATIGLYGMLRRPDIFEQLHAAGLVTTAGVILVLLASISTTQAETVTSALLIVAFVLVTSSLSTHAIALAAWRRREGAAALRASNAEAMAADAAQAAEVGPGVAASGPPMRVIVATDGSREASVAIRLVDHLAWPPGSRIRLLAVAEGHLSPIGSGVDAFETGDDGRQSGAGAGASAGADMRAMLEVARRQLERPGRLVDAVVRRGHAAETVIDEAITFDAQLIVVGSRGLGRVRALFAGSVTAGILDDAPCPVLVARSPTIHQVLLAVDDSEASRAATEVVARWPIFEGLEVHVLSVGLEAPGDDGGPTAEPTRDEPARGRHGEIAEQAAERLRRAGRSAIAHVSAGGPVDEIVDFAADGAIDLIVVGTRGRTGVRRMLLGSVTRDVLAASRASVLVVRPTNSVGSATVR